MLEIRDLGARNFQPLQFKVKFNLTLSCYVLKLGLDCCDTVQLSIDCNVMRFLELGAKFIQLLLRVSHIRFDLDPGILVIGLLQERVELSQLCLRLLNVDLSLNLRLVLHSLENFFQRLDLSLSL